MNAGLSQFDIDQIINVINLAKESKSRGGKPFAAILALNDKVVHLSYDKRVEDFDPTAHAEMCTISEYCRKSKIRFLDNYTIYCSTEPCSMCAGAIRSSRISKVVFSVTQTTLQKISGGKIKHSCRDILSSSRKHVDIIGPIFEEHGMQIFEEHDFE